VFSCIVTFALPDEDELELLLDELDDEELLVDELDELELDELLLDDELDELELLLELDDELLLDEDELELDELLVEPPSPVQVGNAKLPLCVPWKPNEVLCPAARLPFQPQQLLKVTVEVEPPDTSTFQLLVTLAGWLKPSWTAQPLMEPGPVLVTVTSS
jgi:hypothetical protein